MATSPLSLDLSFTPGPARSWARVLVVRPSRDYDDAVTLNSTAANLDDFEDYLDRLQADIEIIRDKARQAFEQNQSLDQAA
jgi:hypothetical protein